MTLMRFDPFRELDRLGERMLAGPAMRAMPTEAYRRGDSFYVLIDVPGVDPSELQVTVERNVVSAQASRRSPRQEGDELLVDERPHGDISRQFFLGDFDELNANDALVDVVGLLGPDVIVVSGGVGAASIVQLAVAGVPSV